MLFFLTSLEFCGRKLRREMLDVSREFGQETSKLQTDGVAYNLTLEYLNAVYDQIYTVMYGTYLCI